MEMICQGPTCGQVFEGKRRTAKYCSKACSMAASRAGKLGEPTPAGPGRAHRQPAKIKKSYLARFTERELAAMGRLDTSAGQAALILAMRIDHSDGETGAAVASMVKEHAAAMERALSEAAPDDPVKARQDEVAARRERNTATS